MGASPITKKVARRMVSNAGSPSTSPKAADRNKKAIITSPSANESMSSARERRSGRPVLCLRAASTPIPASETAASTTSWTRANHNATLGSETIASRLSGPNPSTTIATS